MNAPKVWSLVHLTCSKTNSFQKGRQPPTKPKSRNSLGKRAHHNALEQQRRGVIRGCFESLRKSVPSLASDNKKLSRSGILRETAVYIKTAKERVAEYADDLEELRLQNQLLSGEIGYLGYLQDMTRPQDDLNSFTKIAMEGDETEGSQNEGYHTDSIMLDSLPLPQHNKDLKHSFTFVYDTDVLFMEKGLESMDCPRSVALEGKSSTDEECDVDVDVEGFEQTPFSFTAISDA